MGLPSFARYAGWLCGTLRLRLGWLGGRVRHASARQASRNGLVLHLARGEGGIG